MIQRLATTNDLEILKVLRARLHVEKKSRFTADDLWRLGLVRLLEKDEKHGYTYVVGPWFQRMEDLGKICKTGNRMRSTRHQSHGRSIIVWTFPSEPEVRIEEKR